MTGSFCGWYFKCQSPTGTLAVIPAIHGTGRKQTCSIQILTKDHAWSVSFPGDAFRRQGREILIAGSRFAPWGLRLHIQTPELRVTGTLEFGSLTPLPYDIMGPFAMIPFLECRHSVESMRHSVNGAVTINGRHYVFVDALGYWEGDRGRSFPRAYAWTQCFLENGSLMLSVADIPFAGFHFTGTIGIILWNGKIYRLATYLGARITKLGGGILQVTQGGLTLEARLLERCGHPLQAPCRGEMSRCIHEAALCRAYYRFTAADKTVLETETKDASFEYEYPQ